MKGLYHLLLCGLLLCLSVSGNSQNLLFDILDGEGPVGETVCINIIGDDWVNIGGFGMRIGYDTDLLTLVSAMGNVNGANVNLNELPAQPGTISVTWNLFGTVGYTNSEPFNIAQLCFEVLQEVPATVAVDLSFVDPEFLEPNGNEVPLSEVTLSPGVINGGSNQATCDDGIRNGDETGVDCGGPDCAPCMTTPTCNDGMMNGSETGVDCGGSCAPCDDMGGNNPDCGAGSSNLTFCLEEVCDIAENELICLNLYATNFTDVAGFQIDLGFPAGNLFYQSVTTDPRLVDPIIGSAPNGFTARLIYSPQSQAGVSIPDGESIATVCFTNQIAGTTVIEFADLRVGNSDGQPISGVTGSDGSINDCGTVEPTCDDGIRNGNETGVDCGGPDCAACVTPTCDDGIRNGSETGVDCGGSCAPCMTDMACGTGTTDVTVCVGSGCAEIGDNLCIPVFVGNFDELGGLQATLEYGTTGLRYTGGTVATALMNGLVVSNPNPGEIRAVFTDPNGESQTFPADEVAFTLCFDVLAAGGSAITFEAGNNPRAGTATGSPLTSVGNPGSITTNCNMVPTCTDGIRNGNETGIDCGGSCAPCPTSPDCGAGTTDVTVCVESNCAEIGEIVCVPVFVGNWDNLVGVQFTLEYNTTGLEFASSTIATALQTGAVVSNPSPGEIRCVWTDPEADGQTFSNDNPAYTLCFEVLTAGPHNITFEAGNNPRAADQDGAPLPTQGNPGAITTNCTNVPTCNDGVRNGDETGVDCGGSSCMPCMTMPTCNDGIMNGTETGIDCGGSCAPCMVDMDCGEGTDDVTFCVGSGCAEVGASICIPVLIGNFDNLGGIQATVNYNAANLSFDSDASSVAMAIQFGAIISNPNPGELRLIWTEPNGADQSFPADEAAFTLCFDVLAAGGSPLTFAGGNNPRAATGAGVALSTQGNPGAITTNCTSGPTCDDGVRNGDETGVDCGGSSCMPCMTMPTCSDGIMNGTETGIDCGGSCAPCMVDMDCGEGTDDVTFCVGSGCAEVGNSICIPVLIGNFDNLGGIQAIVNYNATNLSFDSDASSVATAIQFGAIISNPNPGELRLIWTEPNGADQSFPADEAAFTLCFDILATGGSPLTFAGGNNPRAATGAGMALSTQGNPGAITTDCTSGPTCTDGIMNGDETGIDCGGSCDPCVPEPTCTDGIMNGDETGVDCGGSCDPCVPDPTCTDGIMNGDETGIDCGGSCTPCQVDMACGEGTTDVTFCVGSACDAVGATVCIPVLIGNFDDLGGLQAILDYDPAGLTFLSQPSSVATALQFGGIISNPNPGELRLIWTEPNGADQSFPNDEAAFTLCFEILAEGGSPITFVDGNNPRAATGVGGGLIAVGNPGAITTDCDGTLPTCDDGIMNGTETGIDCGGDCDDCPTNENLILDLGTGSGAVGEEVCIDLDVTEFTDLTNLTFTVTYDSDNLTFLRADNFAIASMSGANANGATPGQITFNWSSPGGAGQTLLGTATLLQLCFTVDRLVPVPVNFANMPTGITARNAEGQNIGIIPNNGAVNPNAPMFDGLTLQIGSGFGDVGDIVCVPIRIFDFIDMVAFQYTIAYDPTLLRFDRAQNFNLNGFGPGNTNSNSNPGFLRTIWDAPQAMEQSRPDGTVLYELCFEVLIEQLATVSFVDTLTFIDFSNTEAESIPNTLFNGQINGSQAPVINSAMIVPVTCRGESDASITLSVSGGNNLTYLWQPNVSMTNVATGLRAGTYGVTVTNPVTGQSTSASYVIRDPAELNVAVSNVMGVSCFGESDGSITLSAVGGVRPYLEDWSGNLPDNVLQQTGLDGGSYSVTLTDANGCSRSFDNIQVREPTAALQVGGTPMNIDSVALTPGGVTTLVQGGTSPFTYAWTGPGGYTASTNNINNATTPGTYCVTVTDINGCTDQQCFQVLVQLAISNFEVNTGCAGDNDGSIDITVIGGTGDYTYQWGTEAGPFANTQDVDELAPNDYTVTVMSGTQSVTATIEVEPATPILLPATTTPSTNGSNGSITLVPSGGNPPYSFLWSNDEETQNLTGLAPGEYCVTVTDNSDCTADMCYTVAADQLGLVTLTSTPASCSDTEDGMISLELANGAPPYTIRIQPLDSTIVTDMNVVRVGVPPGTYTLVITGDQGGRIDTTITVESPPAITAGITSVSDTEDLICTGSITLVPAGGSGPYTVAWSNNESGTVQGGLCAGSYDATITDNNGCTFVTDSIRIGRIDENVINIQSVSCDDGMNGIIDIDITGGVEPYSYAWRVAGNDEVISDQQDLAGVGAGNYEVTIRDATGAMLVRSYEVGNESGFSFTVAVTSDYNGFGVSCNKGTDGSIEITVSGTGTYTYEFILDDVVVGIDSVLENAAPGNYVVSVLDGNGCEITRRVELTAPEEIELSSVVENVSCSDNRDGSIIVTAASGVAPYRYLWSNNADTRRIQGLGEGEYSVTVTDDNGCTASESFVITQPEALAVTFEAIAATDGCDGSIRILPLGGSGDYTFLWPGLDNQGDDPLAEGLCPGSYTFTVEDANGCQQMTMTAVVEDRRFPCLNTREVLTPNGDGSNDDFVIFCSGDAEAADNNLEVYNRWGQLVFEMANYNCSLDGDMNCFEGMTNDGVELPAGPYYFVFDYFNPLGERRQLRGSLTIVRD